MKLSNSSSKRQAFLRRLWTLSPQTHSAIGSGPDSFIGVVEGIIFHDMQLSNKMSLSSAIEGNRLAFNYVFILSGVDSASDSYQLNAQ